MNLFGSIRNIFTKGKNSHTEIPAVNPHLIEEMLSKHSMGNEIAKVCVNAIMESPSTVYAYLKAAHPIWFEKAIQDPFIAHIINVSDNKIGVGFFTTEGDSENKIFDATQPNIVVNIIDDTSSTYPSLFLMVLHDCKHHSLGGVLPLYEKALSEDSFGECIVPKDIYVTQELLFEFECIYFSDIHCHKVIGFDEIYKDTKIPSLGGVLTKLGAKDEKSQRECLRTLFIDHQLPDGSESLNKDERLVLLAIIERGKIDKALSEKRWEILTQPKNVFQSVSNIKTNPLALTYEAAKNIIDSNFEIELTQLSHEPLRQFFIGLRNAINRKKREELLIEHNGIKVSNKNTLWKNLDNEVENLLSQPLITFEEAVNVLTPYFTMDIEYLADLTKIPAGFQVLGEHNFPSSGLFDPKSLKLEYPSNYAATRWNAFIVTSKITPINQGLPVERKYHDFVGWNPEENERGSLQFNFHFWPDARLYGYKARSEGKTTEGQSWYLSSVEPLPDFSYEYLGASIICDYSGMLIKEEISKSQHQRHVDNIFIGKIFNFGFSTFGLKECSFLRKPLLMSPCDPHSFNVSDTLPNVYGSFLQSEYYTPTFISRYGHEVLERITRGIYGSPSMHNQEVKALTDYPEYKVGSIKALTERYYEREIAAFTFSHFLVNKLSPMDLPITFMARLESLKITPKLSMALIEETFRGQDPSTLNINHEEFKFQLLRMYNIGKVIPVIAEKKHALLMRYGNLLELNPFSPTLGDSIKPEDIENVIRGKQDSFPQFMLSNYKLKTLYPIITYFHIIHKEIDVLLDRNDPILKGGEFHGRNVFNMIKGYEESLRESMSFFDEKDLCDSKGNSSPLGRFIKSTQATVSVDELVDGGTRKLNEITRGLEIKLREILSLEAFLTNEQLKIYNQSEDIFGKIELIASLLCYKESNVLPTIALEPYAISFDEVMETHHMTPFELFQRRADLIPKQARLTAEVQHDTDFPESMIFSKFAFILEAERVISRGINNSVEEVINDISRQFGRQGLFTVMGIYPEENRKIPKIKI